MASITHNIGKAMSSSIKPIRVWGAQGPNPPKVAVILEKLGVPYELIPIPITEVKNPKYTAINPNGRIPAIEDPNMGLTLWESGAIVEYLVEKYDKERKISFEPDTPEFYLARQWLFYQVSGQAPYYGQAVWFKKYHPEKVPSAAERYVKEINRVTGVLNGALAKQREKHGNANNGPWLVGNKLSYADLSFLTWQSLLSMSDLFDGELGDYPLVKDWISKMMGDSEAGPAMERARPGSTTVPKWEGFEKYV